MDEKEKKRDIRRYIIIFILANVVIAIILILAARSGDDITDNESLIDNDEISIEEQEDIEVVAEEDSIIIHPIVGKWKFYMELNDMVNSEWTLTFNSDGTYETNSSIASKEGLVPKKDIYAYGTYTIKSSATSEEFVYFHEVHQKTLDVDFTIEVIEGIEYLSFYRSNGNPIVAGRLDGEEIYEKFIRLTEE